MLKGFYAALFALVVVSSYAVAVRSPGSFTMLWRSN